jgi:hypothetical protein
MKIVKLEVSNFKRIKALEITPKGSVVSIRGKNGAGKSSCLDAIAAVFGGADLCPSEPVRRGADGAMVRVELDEDFVAERRWTAGGSRSTLTLKHKDGEPYNKAQTRLDDLIGKLTFDPLAFTRLPAKEQAETIRRLSGLDFTQLDANRAKYYASRTDANRQVDQVRARLATMPEVAAPPAEVSAAELTEEHQRRSEQKTANERKRLALDAVRVEYRRAGEEVERIEAAIKGVQEQIAALQTQLADRQAQLVQAREAREQVGQKGAALKTEVAALRDPDLQEIPAKLREIESINASVRAAQARQDALSALDDAEATARDLDASIKQIDEEKAKLLAKAKFPISGLSFSDAGVTYHGLPFDQASQAEQLRISVAIGAALNPKLRAMLVRDGSLLDEDSLELLRGEAERLDLQVFLETVSSGPGDGILIVDGEVEGAEVANG